MSAVRAMPLSRRLKILASRLGFQVRTRSRYYQYWSHLYRRIFFSTSQQLPVRTFQRVSDLAKILFDYSLGGWRADGPRELWDACSPPEYVEWVIQHGGPYLGDCDEFAIYAVATLNKSIRQRTISDVGLYLASFLTVVWIGADGAFEGHNVCLLTSKAPAGDLSYSYMDYGPPSTRRPHIVDVVRDVLALYAPGGTCTGYAIQDEDLLPWDVRDGSEVPSTPVP